MNFPFNIRKSFGLFLMLFLANSILAGCYDPPPPERVFVPGPEVSATVTISVSTKKAVVDEPIILYASRMTSGFVEIPYDDVPSGAQWWRQMPPAFEKEVAGNLRWFVEPDGKAKFNTNLRKDFTREVRFTEPGTYELYGISSAYGPEPVTSKTVTIEVFE
jgi:hypothetical protein